MPQRPRGLKPPAPSVRGFGLGTQRVPRLDPALSRCGFCNVIARRQPLAGRPYKPNNHTTMQKPSFEERAQEMHEAAFKLKEIAEVILLEAQRMQSANERFNARKGAPQTKATGR